MKASTTYDWEALRGLDPFAPAPSDLITHVFDGGHRLAALWKIKAHSGPLRCWPVELFPEGKTAFNDWATWQHLNNSLKDHPQANIQVFRAYISVLNLAILDRPSSSCEKWAGLVAVLDQFHSCQVYTYQDLAPIHNIVKTLQEGSGSSSKKEAWHSASSTTLGVNFGGQGINSSVNMPVFFFPKRIAVLELYMSAKDFGYLLTISHGTSHLPRSSVSCKSIQKRGVDDV